MSDSDLICPMHDGRPCVMACVSCTYFFVCDKCIEGDAHRGHKLKTFDSASKTVIKRLGEEKDTNAVLCRQLVSDLAQCSSIIQKERDLSDSRQQTIISRRESLKRHIDLVAENLLQQHGRGSLEVLDRIDAEKKHIQTSIVVVNEFLNEVNSLMTCENATEIIAVGRLLARPDIVRRTFPMIERPVLMLERDSTDDDIRHLFGKEVMESVNMSHQLFFTKDNTFVLKEESLSSQLTHGSTHEAISEVHEDNTNVHSFTKENQNIVCAAESIKNGTDSFCVASEVSIEDNTNAHSCTNGNQDMVCVESTKNETESFYVASGVLIEDDTNAHSCTKENQDIVCVETTKNETDSFCVASEVSIKDDTNNHSCTKENQDIEDNTNVHVFNKENQDIIRAAEPTKNETDSFCLASEDLKPAANLPFLPLLETEIVDDTDMLIVEPDVTQLSDSDGNLPCENMKHYDNFLHHSGEFSQSSESTWDGSISSSVSTLASDPFDNTQRRLDEMKCDILPNEEEVFVSPQIASPLESLTVSFLSDHQEIAQQDVQERDTNVTQVHLPNAIRSSPIPEEEDIFSPKNDVSEEPSYSYDEESDTSSFGKVMERGGSFKQNYFESVHFEKFDTHVTEIGDTLSKKSSNDSGDIEYEPVKLRPPKSKTRDLFPSKEFPIMDRKSREIDEERSKDKLDDNKDDVVLRRVLFEDKTPMYRATSQLTDFRQSSPDTNKSRTMPVSRAMSALQLDPSVNLKIKQAFSIDSPVIIACPTTEGRCWLSSFNRENEIVLVNRRGRVKRTVQFGTLVLGMTMLDSSQLLVCCRDEMCIKQVLPDFQVRTFFSTTPLRPSYICSGFTDEMFVTLTDKTTWSIEDGSTSVVVKYSGATCQEMARAQFDADADDMFFFPSRICLNNRCRSVAVINYTSPSTSHLVLLDRHMTLILRYIDNNKVILAKQSLPKLSEKFFITDVIFDPFDNIIIAEHYKKEVQLLDQSCQLLRVLVSEQATPWSLALHNNGYLWVGFDTGSIHVYSSKLKAKRVMSSLQRSMKPSW